MIYLEFHPKEKQSTFLKLIHVFYKAQLILNLTFAHSFLVSKNHRMLKNR